MEKENIEMMPPQKTWFFQDNTGRVFPANEKEAFNLLTENSRWRRQDIKMVGVSDGTTYHKKIQELKQETSDLAEEVKELEKTLNRYIQGHDRLLFDEFLLEDDEKVLRVKKLIKQTEDNLTPKKQKLDDIRKNIVQQAVDAEFEVAKGHLQNPQDFTVVNKAEGKYKQQLEELVKNKRVL